MKSLHSYINEKLVIKTKTKQQKITPFDRWELNDVILDHFKKHNGDLNDINVSELNKKDFYRLFFELKDEMINNNITKINISSWELYELYHDDHKNYKGMFDHCRTLGTVILPDFLEVIGNRAFCNCTDLHDISIPGSVTEIGNQAFSGCSGLTSVNIGDSIISIGEQAFRDCGGLESVIIGSSVETIGLYAFTECPTLKITVPHKGIQRLVRSSGFDGEIIIK